jgi:hypothetical protein
MAAANLTEFNSFLLHGFAPKFATVDQLEQNDWIVLPCKGAFAISPRLITGAAATITRGTVTVNNKGTAYTATTKSIAYDTGTLSRSTGSFYLKTASGEIIEVTDSAPTASSGTLTVIQRGCFGTTPSATGIADDNVLYVLNNLKLGDNQADPVEVLYYELPFDTGVKLFG